MPPAARGGGNDDLYFSFQRSISDSLGTLTKSIASVSEQMTELRATLPATYQTKVDADRRQDELMRQLTDIKTTLELGRRDDGNRLDKSMDGLISRIEKAESTQNKLLWSLVGVLLMSIASLAKAYIGIHGG